MRRFITAVTMAALPLLLGVSIASAQTTTNPCTAADANNARVKETCPRDVVEMWDANKCLWLKCPDPKPAAPNCTAADENNASVKESCKGEIFQVREGGCVWMKCREKPTVTNDSVNDCSLAEKNNARVKESCKTTILEKTDAKGCVWLRCEAPVPTAAETATPVQCKKVGCTVRCADGTSYDICKQTCVRPPVEQQSTEKNDCKRVKGTDGCITVVCGGVRKERVCPNGTSGGGGGSTGGSTGGGQTADLRCETKRDGRCLIKTCSDGTVTRQCGPQ